MLTAPADGPVAAAAAGRAVLLVPSIEVPPGLTLPRALSAGLLLLDTLELLETEDTAVKFGGARHVVNVNTALQDCGDVHTFFN